MKSTLLSAFLALALATAARAADPAPAPAPPSLAELDRDIQELSAQLRDATEKIADLQKRMETAEDRLGETFRPVSPFDTIERRLEDLEKDMDDLKRR